MSGSERSSAPDCGVAASGYVCQNEPEHPDDQPEVEMVSSGPGEGGVVCPECGRMAGGPDDEIPYGDPPDYANRDGTDVDGSERPCPECRGTGTSSTYTIEGEFVHVCENCGGDGYITDRSRSGGAP